MEINKHVGDNRTGFPVYIRFSFLRRSEKHIVLCLVFLNHVSLFKNKKQKKKTFVKRL